MAKEPLSRSVPFDERRIIQQNRLKLPPLPTTTIGSFPQTAEVRKARLHYRKGEWSAEQYRTFIQQQIKEWIDIQEDIGIDVLVHGEFERTDMVEFFGEKLKALLLHKTDGCNLTAPAVLNRRLFTEMCRSINQ
ncbi:hypothetical protein ABFY57_00260 [Paenibacillus polymyxa]